MCECFHFLPRFLWRTGQLNSLQRPQKLNVDDDDRKTSYFFCHKNSKSIFFSLLLLLFLQLFSLCLNLWLDRPSVLASFLIGRGHPGSVAVIGCCGILLQSSGVLTLPDVCPAAGWQSSEPALRLDTQMHDEAEFLRGSSSVGFLDGGRSSQVKESERDRRMWSSREVEHNENSKDTFSDGSNL